MDIVKIIETVGYVGIFAIVFAESGLLIGFFLPGDSLLFTAGILASRGVLNIEFLLIGTFLAAVLGDSFGYMFGRRVGKRLFNREDSWLFQKKYLKKAEGFYERHGKKTIVIARFVPVVRTFAPIVAGIGDMHYQTFLAYNVVGGFLWATGITMLGYFSAGLIPGIDKYLVPVIFIIIIISILPSLKHMFWDDVEMRRKILRSKPKAD